MASITKQHIADNYSDEVTIIVNRPKVEKEKSLSKMIEEDVERMLNEIFKSKKRSRVSKL